MDPRKSVVKEYREILSSLAPLRTKRTFSDALQRLEMGWLTPGFEILRRIETRKLKVSHVLEQPDSLHRKWFEDLSDRQKGRWVNIFRRHCEKGRLQDILRLTMRRLQQLQKLTQPVTIIPEAEKPVSEPRDVNEIPIIRKAVKSPLNL